MNLRRATFVLATLLMVGVGLNASGGVFGGFVAQTASPGNSFGTASDFRAPTAGRSVIAKTAGGVPGYIHAGGTYFVYADVSDTGNPASGTSSVTANTSNLTALATASPLSAGSFAIGGLPYSHRSSGLLATSTLLEGTYSYTVTSTDAAGNSGSQSFSVTVDNTAPSGADVQTANGGSVAGRAEPGDTITYSFSETIDPNSIISGWDGSSTNVVVRIVNGLLVLGNDGLRVFDSTDSSQLPLGTVDLGRGDYVGGLLGGEIARFGASGTASTMTLSGSTLTITLGTASGQAATTAGGSGTMSWTPSASATDRAGNGASILSASETGGADREF